MNVEDLKDRARRAVDPPPDKPKQTGRYTRFYKVMLVLSTIGTVLGLTSMRSLPEAIELFGEEPVYAGATLVSLLVGLPLAVAALILLWQKHPSGIQLKLASYGVSILTVLVSIPVAGPAIERMHAQLHAGFEDEGLNVSWEVAGEVASLTFYATMAVSIALSIGFATLWWKAWQGQQKHDGRLTNTE